MSDKQTWVTGYVSDDLRRQLLEAAKRERTSPQLFIGALLERMVANGGLSKVRG